MAQLDVDVVDDRRGMLVRISGEGTIDAASELQGEFDALAEQNPPLVVVDLSGLTFTSSMGIGALVRFHGQIKRQGGTMRLAAVQPMIMEVFQRSRLDWAVPIFDTVEAAFDTPT